MAVTCIERRGVDTCILGFAPKHVEYLSRIMPFEEGWDRNLAVQKKKTCKTCMMTIAINMI